MDGKKIIAYIKRRLGLNNPERIANFDISSIPDELFSADQMERHGINLALSHVLSTTLKRDILLERLSASETILINANKLLTSKNSEDFSPAREWLLDNFYLIQEQIYIIRRNLPSGYECKLPQLAEPNHGRPRVYDITREIIIHGDGRWDLVNLNRFIAAYQEVTYLTLGELWAIPLTLGVALIENLARTSQRMVTDRADRKLADLWADKMIEVAGSEPKKLVMLIADMARSDPPMNNSYIAELARRLQGAALALPLSWIEQHLAEEGLTIEHMVQADNKYQAANQITVSNSIASLRRLNEIDWRNFVEENSIINQTLSNDPAEIYNIMDFDTRDRYRQVVEQLALRSKHSEAEVANCAIKLARLAKENIQHANIIEFTRYSHVGFYLIDKGLFDLERQLNIKYTWLRKIKYFIQSHPLLFYSGFIGLITISLTFYLMSQFNIKNFNLAIFILLMIGVLFATSQLAVSLVNLIATLLIQPKALPRLNFTGGIVEECRTLVVIPTMLSSNTAIEELIESLEVNFLGNRDSNLYFMLLTDFNDATTQSMPEDAALLNLVKQRIINLNQRYYRKECDIFLLCHRERSWNPTENIWMGKERKRGKLAELNNLLRGYPSNFTLIIGCTEILLTIKYVITLDSDTQLARESARKYVATMAHPLNRPHFDLSRQRVVRGYSILQPRVADSLSLTGLSRYSRICGSEFGIDPYTKTVSDIYQDIFHEGSFMGKGIYDVDLFITILKDKFPENRILSHDLLEGCYLRSGFISDIPLYEESPNNYLIDVMRRIRWIRGDWQLIPWLGCKVLNAHNQRIPNSLSALAKFKLFDNLRRSLVPIAYMLLFILSFISLPNPITWNIAIIIMIILPTGMKTILEFIRKPQDAVSYQHILNITHNSKRCFSQIILYIICLPHEAWYSLCAILRTLWRVTISHRHLLEWTPYNQTKKSLPHALNSWFITMWIGPCSAIILLLILIINKQFKITGIFSPIFGLWLLSPLIMWWLSKPLSRKQPSLDNNQIKFLRYMARRTWDFFATFINADNHWLPPDNYQEEPRQVIARRTSPTNIGLTLLANLTAYDFGYINIKQLLIRTMHTLKTISNLEIYRGHLYNWYNTETLEPLLPRYISTVDSGNLAGHLLTLRQGLIALTHDKLLNPNYLIGLSDTFAVLLSTISKPFPHELLYFEQLLAKTHYSFINWVEALAAAHKLHSASEAIVKLWQADSELTQTKLWAAKLLRETQDLCDEIAIFAIIPNLSKDVSLQDITQLSAAELCEINAAQDTIDEAAARIKLITQLERQIFSLAQMDISFLYDEASHLMTIGFNVDSQLRDSGSYDLLSSEARLGHFVAIAQGQILQDSWFALGRLLVSHGSQQSLISWSGSMFEYLMPLLVMPTYPGTLLDQTYHAVVNLQIAYGKQCGLPWGMSESGYNAVDTQFNYLYRAFGVPGLGLKRGLEKDLVVAPYASAMALMVEPEAACQNLQRLVREYAVGNYGFYEAIDFTPTRLSRDSKRALVKSFMTHHQGMSLLSFSYLLNNQPMQKRFVADPLLQSTLLLLQERIPKTSAYLQIPKPSINAMVEANRHESSMRIFNSPHTKTVQVHLLSNGNYHTVITPAGGGYSKWRDMAITRWREDPTRDNWGLFGYIRDCVTQEFWSITYQPTLVAAENFKAVFTESHASFSRNDRRLDLHTEIVISPEDDIELRRLRIHNRSNNQRIIEFTSYAEIVLAPQPFDLSQPGFSNLFIETELLPKKQAILATRRTYADNQINPCLFHLLNVYHVNTFELSYETDRNQFIGRGHDFNTPLALQTQGNLSNSSGAVLDPIIAIRVRVTLEPDELVMLDLITGISETRAQSLILLEKYQDRNLANRIFGLAWTHGQVLLHHLNISETEAQLYEKMAGAIIYSTNLLRADARVLINNKRGQPGLWGYGISGDLPIVLLYIRDSANINLVKQLIQAQVYWRRKGLLVDLVILNEEHVGYRQSLHEQIISLITVTTTTDHGCNIIVRATDQIPAEDNLLLQAVARIILSDQHGNLRNQLSRKKVTSPAVPLLNISQHNKLMYQKLPPLTEDLQFFNGLGGYTKHGDEYIIQLAQNSTTPTPWVNVLANPQFGTLVSESGQSYTWHENAHEFRLTPWVDDPVKDLSEEAFYIRDEESGHFWSPTALPCRGQGDYRIRHGFGYSVFEHISDNIYSELWMYVDRNEPVKFFALKIKNHSMHRRTLSITGYIGWILGELRTKNAMHVITEATHNGAILAHNQHNTNFNQHVAFFDATTSPLNFINRSICGDRTEFLGRHGSFERPAALRRKRLSGKVGAGLDPCGVIQLVFDLGTSHSREIIFILGSGHNRQAAELLIDRYHGILAAQTALTLVRDYWRKLLQTITINTPDLTLNFLINGWLLYQVISSRLWGRTGYYQSSGAFGFRDQLQDVMAVLHVAPELARNHILLCAAHQFDTGDVQHWWHPPYNNGVRTRCSDDYLWLPFVLCHYIEATGDKTILSENIPFLQGRPLNPNEESYYELPSVSTESVSIYQHAVRAIKHGLKFGEHGLPLIGSGDWNDGMNRVGKDGKGESVWLAFFLYSVLIRFLPLTELFNDEKTTKLISNTLPQLKDNIEQHAWDGAWYLRAYFDDGSKLGSANNQECKIDSTAQSWAVLSGAADLARTKIAMASLHKHLVYPASGLIKILDPPFNHAIPSPGYIAGYVPGIRENGGQYTHAAIWAAMAFAKLGEIELAWQYLRMLNPINRTSDLTSVQQYKIEPYVIAGDIYSADLHIGRGGWSWYTGSAGYLYQLIIEILLGITLKNGCYLHINPQLPKEWNSFSINYRYKNSLYTILIEKTSHNGSILLDNIELSENYVRLIDDGASHEVIIKFTA